MAKKLRNYQEQLESLSKLDISQLRLMADLALSFTAPGDFHDQVQALLEKVGIDLKLSRVYIFEDSEDQKTTSNTFEWCAEGTEPQIDILQDFPYEAIPSWPEMLEQDGKIYAEDIQSLPDDIAAVLEPQGIQSIVVYPLTVAGSKTGFIGYDECRKQRVWTPHELNFLKVLTGFVSSIFERRNNRRHVEMVEGSFKMFFETIDDLILITNTSGYLMYANQAVSDKLGYTHEELKNKHILDFHPAEVREDAEDVFQEMLEGKRSACILPLEAKSGNRIPAESRIWRGSWGGKPAIYGITKDMSTQQLALDKFNKIFMESPNPMVLAVGNNLTILEANRAFTDVTGYRQDEVKGKSPWEAGLMRDSAALRKKLIHMVLNDKHYRNIEHTIWTREGIRRDGLFSGTRLQFADMTAYLVTMVDITEQNAIKKQIEEEKQRFEYVIEATGVGIWEWYIQTGEAIFNEEWANIIGYTLDELRPLSIETWLNHALPEDLVRSEAELKKHFSGETPIYSCEVRMLHKDGTRVWVHDTGRVTERDSQGNPVRMFGTHTDITRRKLQELELQNTLENTLQGAQAKSLFFAQITHDIKTPLNVIYGLNQLLFDTGLSKLQRDYVGKIQRASKGLLGTIGNLLDYSKIEAGKFTTEESEFSLRAFFRSLCEMYSISADRKGLALYCRIDPTMPDILFGDEVVLRHILQNLLENAVKYTDKGEITLTASPADGAPDSESDQRIRAIFSVHDTGRGIPPESLEHVFNPYSRGSASPASPSASSPASSLASSSDEKPGGTGLGLTICRELAESLGGTIAVKSSCPGGSTFTVEIPFRVGNECVGNRQRKTFMHTYRQGAQNTQSAQDTQDTSWITLQSTGQLHAAGADLTELLNEMRALKEALELGETLEIAEIIERLSGRSDTDKLIRQETAGELERRVQNYNYESAMEIVLSIIQEAEVQLP